MRGFGAVGLLVVALSFGAGDVSAQNAATGGPTTQGQDRFGAIAYSPGTGAHGWSTDYGSREAAESVALQNCRKHAGDCTVPIWFRNACGALAVGPRGYGSGWGTDRSIAERYARESCRKHSTGCQIRRWVCTTR